MEAVVIETVFSTDALPRVDRWASWYDTGNRSHVPTVIETEHQDDFHGTVRLLDLGAVKVSTLTYSPLRVVRTPKLIRQSDPELYYLPLHLNGEIGVEQSRPEQAVLGPRDLVLYAHPRGPSTVGRAPNGANSPVAWSCRFQRRCYPFDRTVSAGSPPCDFRGGKDSAPYFRITLSNWPGTSPV